MKIELSCQGALVTSPQSLCSFLNMAWNRSRNCFRCQTLTWPLSLHSHSKRKLLIRLWMVISVCVSLLRNSKFQMSAKSSQLRLMLKWSNRASLCKDRNKHVLATRERRKQSWKHIAERPRTILLGHQIELTFSSRLQRFTTWWTCRSIRTESPSSLPACLWFLLEPQSQAQWGDRSIFNKETVLSKYKTTGSLLRCSRCRPRLGEASIDFTDILTTKVYRSGSTVLSHTLFQKKLSNYKFYYFRLS